MGLCDERHHRAESLLAPVLGVMTFACSLLIPVNRLDGGVDVDMNRFERQTAMGPDPLSESGGDFEQGLCLVDAQRI